MENAIPILSKYSFPAIVFVVVGEMGDVGSWRSQSMNRRLMDWDSLKKITKGGYSIGSHGLYHYDLTKLGQEELDRETILSRQLIRERLGVEVNSFSYPWGICTEREINSVRKAGYTCAVSVGSRWHNGPETNRSLLERILIEHEGSLSTFVKKLR